MKLCSIAGCGRPHVARGWCARHYARWAATGNPTAPSRKDHPPTCSVPGCGDPYYSSGMCRIHYVRLRAHGVDVAYHSGKPPGCSICHHEDADEIDNAIRSAPRRPNATGRAAPGAHKAIAQTFGIDVQTITSHKIRHLDNTEHAARMAEWWAQKLIAVRQLAAERFTTDRGM